MNGLIQWDRPNLAEFFKKTLGVIDRNKIYPTRFAPLV